MLKKFDKIKKLYYIRANHSHLNGEKTKNKRKQLENKNSLYFSIIPLVDAIPIWKWLELVLSYVISIESPHHETNNIWVMQDSRLLSTA